MKDYLRSFMNRESAGQFMRLAVIGGLNTVVYFILLNVFRFAIGLSSFWSVTWGFILATAMSYVLNRRWTFRLKEGPGSVRETVWFYLINLAAWGTTVAVVKTAEWLFGDLGPLELNLANIVATGFILLPKFAGYRDLVFGKALRKKRESSLSE